MQVWRIAKERYALDRSGIGAFNTGGRWNSQGVAVIYAGVNPGVCALERLVHTSNHLVTDLVLVSIQLPDDDVLYKKYRPEDLPIDWDARPSSTVSMHFGDQFVLAQQYLAIILPSVIMPEEFNIIINPSHPAFAGVTFNMKRPFTFDGRLRAG